MEKTFVKPDLFKLTATALLISIGIVIPNFMPRLTIEPMSFTLASHVVIFLAMFISPGVAIAVTIGTTFGFFMTGVPIVVVLRAASHLVFVIPGVLFLARVNKFKFSGLRLRIFSLVIGVIHGLAETIVAISFFAISPGADIHGLFRRGAFIPMMFLMVGLGTLIHSMVDFEIANAIRRVLERQKHFRQLMEKS
ncbi:MAG: hypothetical protein FWB71_02615 [Defluviitaleaceae bacterium]|nr:hypothetical protein [Defluviitaleaceae bacterium]